MIGTFPVRRTAAAAAVVIVFATSGAAVAVGPSVASQNPSPYATPGCHALDDQPGSRVYLNSEVEPQVAVDPTNPSHLVGVWQQDRWSNGAAHGLVAGYSTDGGASWTVSPQPFSVCYHASGYPGPYLDYQRASDPWVSIGPGTPGSSAGSTVYSVSLSVDFTAYPGDPDATHNAVGAATSYDGGATWTNVQTIIADPCGPGSVGSPGYVCNNAKSYIFNDKESVTADPVNQGVAYAVWDRLVAPPANPIGFEHELAYFGQTMLSKTTDFGRTWSAPRIIVGLASLDQTIGNQIVVDRQTGALYDFFTLIQGASNAGGHRGLSVAFAKSTDGGATWTKPSVVAPMKTVGVSDQNNLNPYTNSAPAPSRTGDIIPEPAINPNTGQLYVVWQDARWNNFVNDEVAISTSTDGGTTWSPPDRVNDHSGEPAYDPSVYVNAAGVVAVSYFQWSTTVSGNEATTLFIRHSTSPGTSPIGPTFDAATALDGPFNNLAAPVARGYFLGDYQGLVASGNGFVPFYVKTNCADGGPTTQPSCRAIQSVLNPTDRTPTGSNSTDVYAAPGS
ncbi:MAG: sialidase family protein [Chloroflexota bacterium]